MSDQMAYLNQVHAQVHRADHFFAHAEREAENWPYCGHLLARALEHAACAVFTAWGEPHAAEKKMHRFFDERLVPHVDPAVAPFLQIVWEREGQGRPDSPVEQLLVGCRRAIDYFAGLAKSPPPADWEPLPLPKPVGWDGLSEEERQFLQEAATAAREQVRGVHLILFGSRAAGIARPDSDYDLFFILPHATADWQRAQAIGSANSLFLEQDLKTSVEWASEADWLDPPEVSRPLIERVKATGIEVPASPPEVAP